jgi:hypothetical protein
MAAANRGAEPDDSKAGRIMAALCVLPIALTGAPSNLAAGPTGKFGDTNW